MSPKDLAALETGAPALNRGLAALLLLGERGPLSLDEIAGTLDLPKASVFRFLGTLVEAGAVRKSGRNRYEALWVVRRAGEEATFEAALERALQSIVEKTGHTAEWYGGTEEGMRLVRQENPPTEVHVKARPGFLREWGPELEAVALLGRAFYAGAPKGFSGLAAYREDGVLRPLGAAECREMIARARAGKAASDLARNSNGVRRHAVAIVRDGRLFGVLAVAETRRYPAPPRGEFFREILLKHAASLLP